MYYQLVANCAGPGPGGKGQASSKSDIVTVTIPTAPKGISGLTESVSGGGGAVNLYWRSDPEAIATPCGGCEAQIGRR